MSIDISPALNNQCLWTLVQPSTINVYSHQSSPQQSMSIDISPALNNQCLWTLVQPSTINVYRHQSSPQQSMSIDISPALNNQCLQPLVQPSTTNVCFLQSHRVFGSFERFLGSLLQSSPWIDQPGEWGGSLSSCLFYITDFNVIFFVKVVFKNYFTYSISTHTL